MKPVISIIVNQLKTPEFLSRRLRLGAIEGAIVSLKKKIFNELNYDNQVCVNPNHNVIQCYRYYHYRKTLLDKKKCLCVSVLLYTHDVPITIGIWKLIYILPVKPGYEENKNFKLHEVIICPNHKENNLS